MRIVIPSNTIPMMDRITTSTTFLQYVHDVTQGITVFVFSWNVQDTRGVGLLARVG